MKPPSKTENMPTSDQEGSDIYLIDTSALFAFIEDEPGSDQVEKALRQKETIVPWPVLLEMYYISQQEEGRSEADRRFALVKRLDIHILYDMDESTVLTAANLKARYRISFADAVIAAIAVGNNAILIHKDPEYEALSGLIRMETLPYKSG